MRRWLTIAAYAAGLLFVAAVIFGGELLIEALRWKLVLYWLKQ